MNEVVREVSDGREQLAEEEKRSDKDRVSKGLKYFELTLGRKRRDPFGSAKARVSIGLPRQP